MEVAMRPIARVTLAAAAALALTACATTNIRSYMERGGDLGLYRTYAWGAPAVQATGDPRLDNNRFFQERVEAAVELQLAARGFEKTEATPDLLVRYYTSVEQRVNADGVDRPYVSCEDCRPFVFDAGTIVVDLIDARTRRLVWRGWEEGSIDGVVDEQQWMEKRIDQAVARIIEQLPSRIGRAS
jgi:hypothetical protein